MQNFIQDFRYAIRMLLRNPGFTLVAVLTLALGIGANTAIFSVVNTVLLKPLPYPNPDSLVKIWTHFTSIGLPNDQNWFSPPELRDVLQQNHSFSDISAISQGTFNLGVSGNPQSLSGATVSPSFFTLLGVNPRLGRTFSPDEGEQGHDRECHRIPERHLAAVERVGLDRGRIKTAISVLAAQGLVHVEHVPSLRSDYGISNAYRLAFIQTRNHLGTRGRGLDAGDFG